MTIVMTMTMGMIMMMMMMMMMMAMTMHLFKTGSKSLLNIFTVSEAIVQVGRVVLSSWRTC